MATIQSAIKLNDMMTAPIRNITNAMNMMLSSWTNLDNATSKGLDVSSVESIRSELNQATRALDQMGKEQDEFNREVNEGTSAVTKLGSKIAAIAGAYLGFQVVKDTAMQAIEYSSDLAEVQNVVDVSFGMSAQTVNEWSKTTLDAFGLNELAAKRYAGTMGAMLKSSGLTGNAVTKMSMKIAELAGDMASFYNLQTDEAFQKIRSGISGETEPLKQLGINMSVANLEAFALSQGIKTAYNEMSQAEQVMLRYNYLLQATADAQGDFARTSESFANQQKLLAENWKAFTGELASGVLPVLAMVFSVLNSGISFLAENWSILQPVLIGVAAALALVNAHLIKQGALWLWNSVIVPAFTAVIGFLKHGYMVLTDATYRSSAAQLMYNNALLACPLTWILLIIIAVIAALYTVIAVINKVTGSTISATGIIVGVLAVAGAFIWNLAIGLLNGLIQAVWSIFVEPFIGIIEWILNACNGGFNSFGDAVANLLGQIIGWFLSLGTIVTKIIDAIFGTNWTDGLNALRDSVTSWGKNEEAITIERTAPKLGGRIEYGNAWNAGYDWGAGVEDSIGNMFGGGSSAEALVPEELMEGVKGIEANTDPSDEIDILSDNLKYMRDIAERDNINRFTTAEIRVEMGGVTNTVNQNMDLDGVVDYMVTGVQEAMERAAEGVHN